MANDIAKEVTERILAQLKAGVCPWKQPWTGFAPTGMDAAYLAHWIKFLTDHETAIMTAASAASKAVAYLKGLALAEETNDEAVAA